MGYSVGIQGPIVTQLFLFSHNYTIMLSLPNSTDHDIIMSYLMITVLFKPGKPPKAGCGCIPGRGGSRGVSEVSRNWSRVFR